MSILQIGDRAPSFNLFSSEKQEINLQSYTGKNVVLLFFPLAFSGTCTKEVCMMRDDISRYNNINAEVIGISVDSVFTLAKFKEENALPFTLLSDFNKVVIKAYGCLREEFAFGYKGVANRSVFVIDHAGIIKHIEILENPGDLPNFDAVNEVLNSLN